MKDRYDEIEEVKIGKTFSEVEKFNPFHDSLGKFSNKMGFKTYSANPKTKAGQMAIARSDAAGHGYTINVHRESKGENIKQNQNWITTGKKPRVPAAQSARLQQLAARGTRSKPAGQAKPKTTQAASKPQTNTPKPQATQAAKPTPKPNQQTQAAPKQPAANAQGSTLAQSVADVKLTSNQKLALQPRNENRQATRTKKVANDNDQSRVAGKDISKKFDIGKMKTSKNPIDAVAEAQGWNKGSTVTNDRDLFDKAALKSGRVMIRTVHKDNRSGDSADTVCKKTMTNGNYSLGGSGAQLWGSGMYVVDCKINPNGSARSMGSDVAMAQAHSFGYGDKQMMITVHPDAKIANPATARKIRSEFYNLSIKDRSRFGNDQNAYIASKGYDGARWDMDIDPTGYTTVFNKSALIFYGGVAG